MDKTSMKVQPEEVIYVYCYKTFRPYRFDWNYAVVIKRPGRKRCNKVWLTAQEFKELLVNLEGEVAAGD